MTGAIPRAALRRMTVCGAIMGLAGFAGASAVDEGTWVNLFDGETLFGWNAIGDSEWTVEDNRLACAAGGGGWLATSGQFQDFELLVRLRVLGEGSAGVIVRSPLDGHPSENGAGMVVVPGGEADSPWREVRVRAVGGNVTATLDGEAVEGLSVENGIGHIGIAHHRYHRFRRQAPLEVAEVQLRPLNLRSIFNGQDLSGWNIIPDRQSEFSVIEGALNVKDGPGQIETDELFQNFIFQLEIFSNGEHLNSGVFFRGPKGVFWLGYEAQVRNQWMRDDRTRPVDFGTGGIYGVQEARIVNSSDHEWFSMTILANHNHYAVWVNGLLVADMVDSRPVDPRKDGKNGYVPDAGTIHLQGHDPATDLSFRSMHIQTYPDTE